MKKMMSFVLFVVLTIPLKCWASWYDTIYITAPSGQTLTCVKYNGPSTTRYYLSGDTATLSGNLIVPRQIIWPYTDMDGYTHYPTYTVWSFSFNNCTHLDSVTIQEGYTSSGSFSGCTGLVSVHLPSTITTINTCAFDDCRSLQSINIPDNVTEINNMAFRKCTSLQEIALSSNIDSIGQYAFDSCVSLTSISIPQGVKYIPIGTFADCHSLSTVTLPDSLLQIGHYTHWSGPENPDNNGIFGGAFAQCTSLSSIILPSTVKLIGNFTFYGCTNLSSVTFSDSTCRLCPFSFSNCGFTVLNLPNSINELGYGVFRKCVALQEVTIPEEMWHIGWYTFDSCISLTTVNFNAENCYWGAETYCWVEGSANPCLESRLWLNCPNFTTLNIGNNVKRLKGSLFSGASGITEVTIPPSVKRIENGAFCNCTSLTTVNYNADTMEYFQGAFYSCCNLTTLNIGNNVRNIPGGFMYNVTSLNDVVIPDSVVSIGSSAFSGCTFDTVVIGSSVTAIGSSAFYIDSLNTVFLRAQTPPSYESNNIWARTFNPLTLSQGVLHVPCGTRELYQSSSWYDALNRGFGFAHIEDSRFEILANTNGHGIVEIVDSSLCEDSTVVLFAIADSGYLFSHWSDGDTTNPRTLILTSDTSLTAYFIVAPTNCNNISLPYAADFTQCWTTEGGASVIASNRIRLGGHGQKATSPWFTIHDSAGLHLKWTLTKDSVNGTVPENDPNFIRKIKVLADDNIRTMQWDNWWGNTISMSEALGAQYAGQTIQVEFEYIGNDSISFSLTDVTLFQFADTVEVSAPIHAYIGDTIVLAAHVSLPEGNYGPYVPYWNFYTSDWTSVSNNSIGVVNNHADTVVAIFNTPGEYIATFAYTVWNVFNVYPVYSNNREVYISIIDTTVVDTLFDCDSITLPYTADFTQCWTATGGATIIDSNQASITSQGQTLTSPWINVPAGTVYYHFTDRRDTTGAYWNSWDSAVWYTVSIEDANGDIVTTANWDSETSSQGKISHFMASGGPIRFVFTYTDTHAVQLHYIENLEIYAYDMSLTVEGPTSVNVGDTVVYVAHVSMPEGEQPDYWSWILYDQSNNNVDSSIATVIATTDSTRTIVWHTHGNYSLCTSIQEYIPQMVWQNHYHYITVLDTTSPVHIDCDSISLPYTADFTQCWTAEGGASVIDANHASITSQGQRLVGPWMESTSGKSFINWSTYREGGVDYDSEQYTLTIEGEDGVITSWTEYAGSWNIGGNFTSPGGRIRVVFEYTGTSDVPSFQITDVRVFQYDIETTLEASSPVAQVGDTVTFIIHSTLQNGEVPDSYFLDIYNPQGQWMYENDPARTIVSHTDSVYTVVWNTTGRYRVYGGANKYVYNTGWASATSLLSVIITDHPAYEEDSIYYTSAAKDTAIGCHPQLHVANLPESVAVIADSAFFNLANLSTVEMPDALRHIGKMAFAWNQGISEITIPQNVTFIGDNAFWWDTNLTTINFNATHCQTMSPSTSEDGNYWPVFIGCDNITTINFGENVNRIPDRAFSYCSGLHGTLVIPDAVTYIGRSAFFHWINDWDWDIGSTWDTLSVVLGAGVNEIGDYAFGCPPMHITSVISHNPEPPAIGEQTFYRYDPEYTPPLQVPCGSVEAYRNAQHWNRFEEITEDCNGIEKIENGKSRIEIHVVDGHIVVEGTDGEHVRIYDMMGRLVTTSSPSSAQCVITMPNTGVYVVKVGDLLARKVVVVR